MASPRTPADYMLSPKAIFCKYANVSPGRFIFDEERTTVLDAFLSREFTEGTPGTTLALEHQRAGAGIPHNYPEFTSGEDISYPTIDIARHPIMELINDFGPGNDAPIELYLLPGEVITTGSDIAAALNRAIQSLIDDVPSAAFGATDIVNVEPYILEGVVQYYVATLKPTHLLYYGQFRFIPGER